MDDKKKRPVKEFRQGGVRAAIWRNEGANGVWYSVSVERSYKEGEEWKTSGSFGRDDLLLLAKFSDLAHTWIVEQEAAERSV